MIDKGDPDSFLVGDALDDDGVGATPVRANADVEDIVAYLQLLGPNRMNR